MIKHLLLITLFCMLTRGIFAQPDIPVDHHTGKPYVGVPLWDLREGEIHVPLSLSYDASGVRLADASEWVGLKWRLNGQGAISRIVKGLPDDLKPTTGDARSGWLWSSNAGITAGSDPSAGTSGCDGAAWTSLNSLMNSPVDKEPDIFLLEAPGLSARIMFDNNGTPRVLPYQQLKIGYERDSYGNIISFTVTDNKGTTYYFGSHGINAVERTKRVIEAPSEAMQVEFLNTEFSYYKTAVTYNSKWHLAKIESASGKKVMYSYILHQHVDVNYPEFLPSRGEQELYGNSTTLYRRCNPQAVDCEGKTEYFVKHESTRSILSVIESSTARVEFSSGGSIPYSYTGPDIFLNTMRVYARGGTKLIKEFLFGYTAARSEEVTSEGQTTVGFHTRKFLTEVMEQVDCLKRPPYLFAYKGMYAAPEGQVVSLPGPGSFQQDFWGYYNNNLAKTLSPKLYVYPSMSGANRYRLHPMKAGNYTGEQVVLEGADRTVDGTRIANGTLSRITYPTGGTIELLFQPNAYFDPGAGANQEGGGIRLAAVKAIRRVVPNDPAQLQSVTLKELAYTNPVTGFSSGKAVALPVLAFPATFYRPIGSTDNRLTYEELQSGSYTAADRWDYLTVRAAYDLSDYEVWAGQPVGYEFVTEKLPGNGKTVFEFDLPGTWGETQAGDWAAAQTNIATAKAGDPMSCPVLGYVEGGFYAFPFPSGTNYDFERGSLKRERVFTEAGAEVKETLYSYQRINGPEGIVNIYGLKFDQIPSYTSATTYVQKPNGTVQQTVVEGTGKPIYLHGKYMLLANVAKVLARQEMTLIDPVGKRLTSTTDFTHQEGLLTEIRKAGPDGSLQRTRLRYPKDFAIPVNGASPDGELADEASAMVRRMKEKHMLATVLESISTVQQAGGNEIVTAATLSTFKPFNSLTKVYPAFMYELREGAGVNYTSFSLSSIQQNSSGYVFQPGTGYEILSQVPGYDAHDKALGLTEPRSKRTKSYHFGYNYSLPVADITDARADAVAFSNFETVTEYGFEVASPVYGEGRTGMKGLNLAPGQLLSRNGIRNGGPAGYTASLWVKAPGASSVSGNITIRVVGATTATTTRSYVALPDKWTLVEAAVPVNVSENSLFRVEILGSTALLVDDVAFYPAVASVSTNTFDPLIGRTSMTDVRGATVYYEYDALGNLEVVRDQDRNIVQHHKYVYYNEKGGLQALIGFDNNVNHYDGDAVAFTAKPYNCQINGITYTWNFGDGTPNQAGSAVSHAFPFIGGQGKNYQVTLTATHPDFGSYQTTREIFILPKPLEVTICADGPISYDACQPENTAGIMMGGCSTVAASSGYAATTYKVTAVSGCPGPYTYQWQTRQFGNEYALWQDIAGATSSTVNLSSPDTYEVRCVVTGCGRTGESALILHYVYKSSACDDDTTLQTVQ